MICYLFDIDLKDCQVVDAEITPTGTPISSVKILVPRY